MVLYTLNHTYKYECEKICRIYFPTEKIVFSETKDIIESGTNWVCTEVSEDSYFVRFSCSAEIDGKYANCAYMYAHTEETREDSQRELLLARTITKVLSSITSIVSPWGVLTGVRPAKLMRKYINTFGETEAEKRFTDFLEVSPEKTFLAKTVAEYENTCIKMSDEKSYSLYVSIPFCPTRCSYCSFVSHSIDKAKKLIPDYVDKLCAEIEETAKIAEKLNLNLETVYMGGGTPTSLSAENLKTVLEKLNSCFPMDSVKEFTVEAGRPDTIDKEKLEVIKNAGVTRISINPQTFENHVLENIGRPHTGEDAKEKYFLARQLGFSEINMDLIAGLPGDTLDGFKRSIDEAITLNPENITVHTLALKRSAQIVTEKSEAEIAVCTEQMVNYANKRLFESGYFPYYMYRQSKCIGNLENVGWCKKDKPCLYNIYMMEEIHTVLSVGAAGVTKLKDYNSDFLKRIYNFKYPYEYIERYKELSERKNEIIDFYSK